MIHIDSWEDEKVQQCRPGSMVVESSYGGWDVIGPSDPLYSSATMVSVGYIESVQGINQVHQI